MRHLQLNSGITAPQTAGECGPRCLGHPSLAKPIIWQGRHAQINRSGRPNCNTGSIMPAWAKASEHGAARATLDAAIFDSHQWHRGGRPHPGSSAASSGLAQRILATVASTASRPPAGPGRARCQEAPGWRCRFAPPRRISPLAKWQAAQMRPAAPRPPRRHAGSARTTGWSCS